MKDFTEAISAELNKKRIFAVFRNYKPLLLCNGPKEMVEYYEKAGQPVKVVSIEELIKEVEDFEKSGEKYYGVIMEDAKKPELN